MAQGGDANLLGRTIAGKYLIDAFLGGGAMGAVYRAHQAALDKVVAIKVMHHEHAKDGMFAARFQREAKAASRLDHPNAMRVFDFGTEPDGLMYIAMEFLDGRDLLRVIVDDWPMTPARVSGLLSQALAALAVAHDMGVVHRDLKPENIMVLRGTDDEGRPADIVKVCDFGIAKISDARGDQAGASEKPERGTAKLTAQGLVIGTPEYMSPEQGKGEPLDARSDLYSMAVILYQMITGRVPFDAESALGVVLKHVTEEPASPASVYPRVDPGLAAVCMQGLRKKREDRYQTARDMRAALRSAAPGDVLAGDGPRSVGPRPLLPTESAPTVAAPVTDPTLGSLSAASPATGAMGAGARGAETADLAVAAEREVPPRRASRAGLGLGVALALVAVVGVGAALAMKRGAPPSSGDVATSAAPSAVLASPAPSSSSSAARGIHVEPPLVAHTTSAASATATATPVAQAPAPRRRSNEPRGSSVQSAPNGGAPPSAPVQEELPAATAVVASPAPAPAPILATTPAPVAAAPAAPPFNPDAGHVKMERVSGTNGLSINKLRTALSRAHPTWTGCYRSALRARGTAAAGEATLHIAIDDTGHVTQAALNGASFLPSLDACIEQSVRSLKIDVDTGEATADAVLIFKSE